MASNKRLKRTPLPTLTDDIIFNEIFPRLPAKSIHRFRCVSTSCRRLLTSDPQFLAAARRHRHYFLSLSSRPYDDQQGLVLYSLNQSGAAREIPTSDRCIHASIVNGLVLTVMSTAGQGSGYKYTVSNADTDETFELPQFRSSTKAVEYRLFFYLCHDPKTDTYKVLRTATAPRKATWFSCITLGAKSWSHHKKILAHQQFGADSSKSVCINGNLYITRFRLDHIGAIGRFIVKEEQFRFFPYPDELSPSRYDQCHLIELKGALAVIDVVDIGNKGFEIMLWKMERYWTTGIRIDFDPRWEMMDYYRQASRSCVFSTNYDGTEIMMGVTTMDIGCWIFIYNVDKGEWTTRVEVRGIMGNQKAVAAAGIYNLGVDQENLANPLSLKSVWDRFPHNTPTSN